MSSKRRKHRPLNLKACKPKPGKSHMDMLFERVKEMEQENKSKKLIADVAPESAGAGTKLADGQLDKHIEEEIGRKLKKFDIIEVEDTMSRKIQNYEFADEQENEAYYIASDNVLSPMMDYTQILEGFIDLLNRVDQQNVYCNNKLGDCDRKIQDFLHELRMPKRNAYEGFKLYQLGHNLEIKRQAYKDALKVLRPLAGFANANREIVQKLQNILESQKARKELCENRVYVPRSDLDLPVGDKFRSLSEEDQQKMRENLNISRRKAC